MNDDDRWQAFAHRIDAHLTAIDQELAALRQTLKAAGIRVHVQRIRVTRRNKRTTQALQYLRQSATPATPADVAKAAGISPEYAFDVLSALVAEGEVERVGRGQYQVSKR